MAQRFVAEVSLPVSADEAFAWHERPGAFERLVPPWEPVRVVERSGSIRDGDRLVMEMRAGPVPLRWVAEHRDYRAGRSFKDVQVHGPFAAWEHTHAVVPSDGGGSVLRDSVEYRLPMGPLGRLIGGAAVRAKLESMFAYRHRTTSEDLKMHARHADEPRMRVAVSGASGLVGEALCALLTTGGHEVVRLVRHPDPGEGEASWDPLGEGLVDPAQVGRLDAVVHLAGENIASGSWTEERKKRILRSRVEGTRNLIASLTKLESPPKVFVCASAIGWYGTEHDDEILDESMPAGQGFLAKVCREWEAEADGASELGIRVIKARLGIVLSPKGGALERMLPIFKLGGGGTLGSGDQWMSWVMLDDVIGAIHHALMNDDVTGPMNVTGPNPVTNKVFTKTLGDVLNRPTILPAPKFALRLVMGEMADEMLLASVRAVPRKLEATGYEFRARELEAALRHVLGR